MRRRATLCAIGAWSLMGSASLISCLVVFYMSRETRQFLGNELGLTVGPYSSLRVVPIALGLATTFILLGGIVAWLWRKYPGWSQTVSAIDWASISDAVARLLAVGCTYPEAFRLASGLTRLAIHRAWLRDAADRVERGESEFHPTGNGRGDASILEALIATSGNQPDLQWEIASQHFFDLANRRLVLQVQSMPIIAMLVSGLLVWISITCAISWMWKISVEMIGGLS